MRTLFSLLIPLHLLGCASSPAPPGGKNGAPELVLCPRTDCDTRHAMGMPNWTCADGSIGGPVCARMKDERCGWIVNDCTRTTRVDTRLTPPRKETVSPAPANPRHCTQLPGLAELRKWRIETICGPGSSFPAEPPGGYRTTVPDVIVDLKDGTFIAEVESLGCVRLRVETCHRKCLPGETLIATPRGAIPIAKLEVGALVWTLDRNGQRILGSVSKVHREAVGREHRMMAMALSDDRRVKASAGHPDFRGRAIERLRAGDLYDGAVVESVREETFEGTSTYDIFPSGGTGVYWANGVPLRSTFRQ